MKVVEKAGLPVNMVDKIKYLIVSCNINYGLEQHIKVEGHIRRRVLQFKYLRLIQLRTMM